MNNEIRNKLAEEYAIESHHSEECFIPIDHQGKVLSFCRGWDAALKHMQEQEFPEEEFNEWCFVTTNIRMIDIAK